MNNLPEITPKSEDSANMNPVPVMELELPIADEPMQVQPDIENPISGPSTLGDHETFKKSFRKNGLDYELLNRTERVALFELRIDIGKSTSSVCGYEVCKINFNKARTLWGKDLPESESVPSNEQFGYDGSKCFFPHDLERAKEYFKKFDDKLSGANMPNLLLPKAIKGTFTPSVVLPP